MSVPAHLPPHTAKVIEVVFVPAMRGDGSKENPERLVCLYFSRDGELLACHDPLNGPPDSFAIHGSPDATAEASASIPFDLKSDPMEVSSMNTPPPIYDYVLACLADKTIPQRHVAEGAGVPYSTVAKIAQGVVTDPSVHTVQKLHDYFCSQRSTFPTLPQGAAVEASA